MRILKSVIVVLMVLISISQVMASIPLGAGRKTATGTVDMYGCLQANDYYIVNFAAYPIAATQAKKPVVPDCINITATGNTVLSLDLLDRDVRAKKVALKVLTEAGQLLYQAPFAMAKQGVISAQVNLTRPGRYQAMLYVQDQDLKIDENLSALLIPLTVAMPEAEPAARNTVYGLFILISLMVLSLAVVVPRLLQAKSV